MKTPPHLTAALRVLYTARPAYDEAARYYEGTVPEVFASRRLQQLLGNAGSSFRVNYARTPVDVMIEKTKIQGIVGTADLTYPEMAWTDNDLGLEAKDLHRRAYEFGDSYLIAWPDDQLPCGVSAYAHDPRQVRVFYDPTHPRTKSHAIHEWTERGDDENELPDGLWWRVNLYTPEGVEQYVSLRPINEAVTTTPSLITYNGSEVEDPGLTPYPPAPFVPNPTPGVIPVFHFRTARPYGRPEHADAYGPQNMLNKLNITMMSSVDYAGFPQRYVATESALSNSPDDSAGYSLDDPDPTQGGLSEDSEMEAGPGNTWLLSGKDISVGEFHVAETRNFLNAIESIVKQMAAITDTPAHYFERSGQMPSGESFRKAEQSTMDKVDDREAQFGVTWHEFFEYVDLVNNRTDTDAMVAWAPPGVILDKDLWETAEIQARAGVDTVTIMTERGYSPDQAEKFAAEKQAKADKMAEQLANTPQNANPPAETPQSTPATPPPPATN